MEQHPVPQQISSYQFRLVGDMTLKQFFQLAGGALIALLIYASALPPLIKWPLVTIFGIFGAALAFLPYQDQPLTHWIAVFFRSVYSPTIFTWQKPAPSPQFYQPETAPLTTEGVSPVPTKKTVSLLPKVGFLSSLEESEQTFLSSISQLFTHQPASSVQPSTQTPVQSKAVDEKKKLEMPQAAPTDIGKAEFRPKVVVEKTQELKTEVTPQTTPVGQTLTPQGLTAAQKAQFSLDAAPPAPPDKPNTVTGQVMDPDSKIVEGAILEIKDGSGRSVRALKTNRAGHFLIVTPLLDGKYELTTEKSGLVFEPVFFETKGTIIPPIAVRAKSREKVSHESA